MFFLTAQITSWPQRYFSDHGSSITILNLRLPNGKRGKSYHYIKALASGQKGQEILWYQKGDYIILEGNISISKTNTSLINLNKQLYIYIFKEFPISLEVE